MKSKKNRSIKSHIIIAVTMLLAISFIVVFLIAFAMVRNKLISGNIQGVIARTDALANELAAAGINRAEDSMGLIYRTKDIASFQDGRVMVVSRNYRIVQDTQDNADSEYIISKTIMDVMTGKVEYITSREGKNVVIMRQIKAGDDVIGVIVSEASLSAAFRYIYAEFLYISVIIVLVLVICILIIRKIATNAVSDLEDISEHMEHIAQGNLQERLPEQEHAETQQLADGFNEILTRLSTLDQTRSEFVSNVSHELKTPITSMKVLAESISQNEGADVDDYKEFMTDIIDELDRETKIINDLLTLVRTDSQNNKMNFEEKDINEMMDIIIKTVKPLAKQRSIELRYESYREVMADVDSVKLSLAISNLIENAVKYNIDNGWVRISLNTDHKYFYVKVADSGVGIPEDEKDKVFERFYRVDKARSRDTGGTGLGLAITRSIINAHRGTIKLYSESGKGTTFTVRIPLRQDRSKVVVKETKEVKVEEHSNEKDSAEKDTKE